MRRKDLAMFKKCFTVVFLAMIVWIGFYFMVPNVSKLKKWAPKKTSFMEYREREWRAEGKKILYQSTMGSHVPDFTLFDQGGDYRRG